MTKYEDVVSLALESYEGELLRLRGTVDYELIRILDSRLEGIKHVREELNSAAFQKETWMRDRLVVAMQKIARLENELEKHKPWWKIW